MQTGVQDMTTAGPCILTVNGGSSSIKFALFDTSRDLASTLTGRIERIGLPDARFSIRGPDQEERVLSMQGGSSYEAAVASLVKWIAGQAFAKSLVASGHRVVHGGPEFHQPLCVTADVLRALRGLIPLDPAHLPQEILLIEALQQRFPRLPQIACFDTAFHHAMPRVAQLLPIPRRYEAQGVRRYGFHGLSYEYLMNELLLTAGEAAARGRVILAHLGNGASLAAVHEGKPMDTSMGFTPASGVCMSTRSGDLDPGLADYMARTEQMSPKQFGEMVNFGSGLLGVSETSSDMSDLLRREAADARAAEAVALFCYHVKKWIGAFAAALGGIDTLVFAGGIGEKSPLIRARICAGLGFLGIALDPARNEGNQGLVCATSGAVRVRVMRTNEELVIARSVCRLLGLGMDTQECK